MRHLSHGLATCLAVFAATASLVPSARAEVVSSTATATAPNVEATSDGDKPSPATSRSGRNLPDYDGRPAPDSTVGEKLLWVPRVAMFPLWLVSEYIVRQPLGWLIVNAEQNQWPKLVLDFFTFGEERTGGVFPTAIVDFGFRPSIGVYAFWDELIHRQNSARLYASYGGDDYYVVRVSDRIRIDEGPSRVAFTFGATRRPDYRFEGIGALAADDFLARYREDRIEGQISFESPLGEAGFFRVFGGTRRITFREGGCCENLSLDEAVATGLIEAPPGYQTDYALYEHGVRIEIDTRKARPASGNGLRLEFGAAQTFDLGTSLKSPWVSYGAAAGGFLDLTGTNRTLSLFVSAQLRDPIETDGIIPFTELVTIGGSGLMQGFRPGTLLGRSSIVGELEYRWPIWVFLDGSIHAGIGNVFGPRFDDFAFDRLRMSFGFGIRTIGRPDQSFNMLIAAGTDIVERGLELTTFRFTLGTTRGF